MMEDTVKRGDIFYADLSPVVGDPVDDPRYAEYFTTSWVDRIRPTR